MVNPELVSVWMMDAPAPAENPATLGELAKARQAKVDEGTSAWRKMAVGVLLQIPKVVVVFEMTGRGLTISTTSWVIPGGQPLATGVT